jgi:hypothetical protein
MQSLPHAYPTIWAACSLLNEAIAEVGQVVKVQVSATERAEEMLFHNDIGFAKTVGIFFKTQCIIIFEIIIGFIHGALLGHEQQRHCCRNACCSMVCSKPTYSLSEGWACVFRTHSRFHRGKFSPCLNCKERLTSPCKYEGFSAHYID